MSAAPQLDGLGTRSAVGEGRDRDAVVALAHAELVGAAVGAAELGAQAVRAPGRRARAPRDRAVDDVVLAAVGVGVAPAGRRARRAPRPARVERRAAAPGDASAGSPAALSSTCGRAPSRPPSRWRTPSRLSTPLATQGVIRPADQQAAQGEVEPGPGRLREAAAVQPDPALGVLGAPVVADHPRPARRARSAAAPASSSDAVEARQRAPGW